jgi:glycosyltransferase involved in cell wall biosynthesis
VKEAELVVITPTLGRSPFLERTVASVAEVAKKLPVRHLLVCPGAVRQELARRFPEVESVAERSGGSLYSAIEDGLEASGSWKWFTYINDDDYLEPGFAELVARYEEMGTEAIAYGLVDLVDECGGRIASFPVCRNPRAFYALWWMGLTPFTQQGTLVSRAVWEQLGGFEKEFRLNADFAFWARAIEEKVSFSFYPLRVAAFRMRSGQLSSDLAKVAEEKRRIHARYFRRRPGAGERLAAWLSFRATNLGAYAARIRRRGWRRSEQLLGKK